MRAVLELRVELYFFKIGDPEPWKLELCACSVKLLQQLLRFRCGSCARAMRSLCSAPMGPMARRASPRGMRPCGRGHWVSDTTRVVGGEASSTSAAVAGGGASLRLRPHALHSVWPKHHLGVSVAPHSKQCGRKLPASGGLGGGCSSSSPTRLARRALGERLHAAGTPLSPAALGKRFPSQLCSSRRFQPPLLPRLNRSLHRCRCRRRRFLPLCRRRRRRRRLLPLCRRRRRRRLLPCSSLCVRRRLSLGPFERTQSPLGRFVASTMLVSLTCPRFPVTQSKNGLPPSSSARTSIGPPCSRTTRRAPARWLAGPGLPCIGINPISTASKRYVPILPEVREFIRDTKPREQTRHGVDGGRAIRRLHYPFSEFTHDNPRIQPFKDGRRGAWRWVSRAARMSSQGPRAQLGVLQVFFCFVMVGLGPYRLYCAITRLRAPIFRDATENLTFQHTTVLSLSK